MTRPLHSLKNIGPKTANLLIEIGIRTDDDLRTVGVVDVYRRAKYAFPKRISLNCLYALEAALLDVPINHLDPALKQHLKQKAEGTS